MNNTFKKEVFLFFIGALIAGLAVYLNTRLVESTVTLPELTFTVPYKVHSQISENYIFRISDKQLEPAVPLDSKIITIPKEPEILNDEQFNDLALGNMTNSAENGTLRFGDFTAKYFKADNVIGEYTAFLYDRNTGKTWQINFDNFTATEVFGILRSIKIPC